MIANFFAYILDTRINNAFKNNLICPNDFFRSLMGTNLTKLVEMTSFFPLFSACNLMRCLKLLSHDIVSTFINKQMVCQLYIDMYATGQDEYIFPYNLGKQIEETFISTFNLRNDFFKKKLMPLLPFIGKFPDKVVQMRHYLFVFLYENSGHI